MSKEAKLLFIAVYLLLALGIVMTYSASAIYADHVYGNPYYFLIRQISFVCIGTLLFFASASLPLHFWKQHARSFILLSLILLLLVFAPILGRAAGGAKRWIHVAGLNFQPAEFAKLAICIYLSDYLSRKIKFIQKKSITIFFPPLSLIAIICIFLLLQPDLGSAIFGFLIAAVLFFVVGIPIRYVVLAGSFFLPVFYFLVIRVPYRWSRVTAYLNPWEDPQGSGFQIIQSFLAFGLGGLQGVGIGQSTQKLFYLPSAHTDFILAIIAEELGLIGLGMVVLLYGVIFFVGIQLAERSRTVFEKLLAISLTISIILQAIINMLVSTGLIPTKGLPLPFISYGGTSIVINMITAGILLGIDRHQRGGK